MQSPSHSSTPPPCTTHSAESTHTTSSPHCQHATQRSTEAHPLNRTVLEAAACDLRLMSGCVGKQVCRYECENINASVHLCSSHLTNAHNPFPSLTKIHEYSYIFTLVFLRYTQNPHHPFQHIINTRHAHASTCRTLFGCMLQGIRYLIPCSIHPNSILQSKALDYSSGYSP